MSGAPDVWTSLWDEVPDGDLLSANAPPLLLFRGEQPRWGEQPRRGERRGEQPCRGERPHCTQTSFMSWLTSSVALRRADRFRSNVSDEGVGARAKEGAVCVSSESHFPKDLCGMFLALSRVLILLVFPVRRSETMLTGFLFRLLPAETAYTCNIQATLQTA